MKRIHVEFQDLNRAESDELFKFERQLSERGITFDRGAGFGARDWELDWSLKGATAEEVLNLLKEEKPELYKKIVCYT